MKESDQLALRSSESEVGWPVISNQQRDKTKWLVMRGKGERNTPKCRVSRIEWWGKTNKNFLTTASRYPCLQSVRIPFPGFEIPLLCLGLSMKDLLEHGHGFLGG